MFMASTIDIRVDTERSCIEKQTNLMEVLKILWRYGPQNPLNTIPLLFSCIKKYSKYPF